MKGENIKSKMMLQVHDELVFEVVPEEVSTLPSMIKQIMEEAFPIANVPILAETGIGNNWYEAH